MNIPTKRLLSALVVAGFVLAGCSNSSEESSSSQASSISTVVKENLVLGTKTSQALRLVLTNMTDLDIDSVKLVPIESDENVTAPELMPSQSQWKNGDQADLYVQSGDKSIGMSLEIQAKEDGETVTYTMPVFPTAALFDAALLASESKTSETSSTASSTSSQTSTSSSESNSRSTLTLQSILKVEDGELVMTWRQDGQTMSSQDFEAPEPIIEEVEEEQVVEEPVVEDQTPTASSVSQQEPTYTEPVVETPTVQEPTYSQDDLYYDEPIYIPPTTSTTVPSSPVVDPNYGTPIVNPTEAPSTPTAPDTTVTTPSVPDQGGENCVNPGDLILNSESNLMA